MISGPVEDAEIAGLLPLLLILHRRLKRSEMVIFLSIAIASYVLALTVKVDMMQGSTHTSREDL